jgi:hypothetical protein
VTSADGDVCLPRARADAVAARLEHYAAVPALCGAAVEEQGRRDQLAALAALDAAERATEVRLLEVEAERWAWWEVGLVGVGAGVVGVVVGAVVGAVVASDAAPVVVTP